MVPGDEFDTPRVQQRRGVVRVARVERDRRRARRGQARQTAGHVGDGYEDAVAPGSPWEIGEELFSRAATESSSRSTAMGRTRYSPTRSADSSADSRTRSVCCWRRFWTGEPKAVDTGRRDGVGDGHRSVEAPAGGVLRGAGRADGRVGRRTGVATDRHRWRRTARREVRRRGPLRRARTRPAHARRFDRCRGGSDDHHQ